jgi:hypothetical protein
MIDQIGSIDNEQYSLGNGHCNEPSFHDTQPHMMPIFPKINIKKLNGSNSIRCVAQMEQYFTLQGIEDEYLKL